MTDTSVKKVDSAHSPKGQLGQKYLASGKSVSMRLWENEEPNEAKEPTSREYETVGYVINGRAELHLEGQVVVLEPGNSWVVPKGASHTYKILEPFSAVEATSPPRPSPRTRPTLVETFRRNVFTTNISRDVPPERLYNQH